jgi:hypothetical protein
LDDLQAVDVDEFTNEENAAVVRGDLCFEVGDVVGKVAGSCGD